MKNLESPFWIKIKGLLFLALGVMASGLLLLLHPDFQTALLLGIALWAFCRSYYCAFYVIEHYVDGRFRFSGLGSFARYLVTGFAEPSQKMPNGTLEPSTKDESPS